MRKLIGALNMTLDGYCDHTAGIADDELHQHYNDLLKTGDTIIYGRITYQLMESYWPTVVEKPTGNKATDEFAVIIDDIHKFVFSRTLHKLEWKNSTLAKGNVKEEVTALKEKAGKDIFVGSRSLIVTLLNLQLIDELQICVQPVLAGEGLSLFQDITKGTMLKRIKTKTLNSSGSVILYYQRQEKLLKDLKSA